MGNSNNKRNARNNPTLQPQSFLVRFSETEGSVASTAQTANHATAKLTNRATDGVNISNYDSLTLCKLATIDESFPSHAKTNASMRE